MISYGLKAFQSFQTLFFTGMQLVMHTAHELAGFIQCRDDALRSVLVLWKLPRKVIRSNCDDIKATTLSQQIVWSRLCIQLLSCFITSNALS